MRILVVDDDAVFREEFALFLSDERHAVTAVPSVAKAIESLEQEEFEVVFTDLKMPRQSGIELLKTLRERWPGQCVIMVTGYATVSTAVEAMKLGAFDYVGKPFRTEQVRKVLELVAEQLRYSGPRLDRGDPIELARQIGERDHVPVMFAGPAPAPKGLPADSTFVAFDGRDPSRLRDELESFLKTRPRAALVLAHLEDALEGHRTEDIVVWLGTLRAMLQGRGVLAVGLDAHTASNAQVQAITEALAAPAVHGTLEALSNPIRRRIMGRLAQGPSSFSVLMHAAELDDSPKMSFHMHRLVEEGLIAHGGEEYRSTSKGEGASTVLREMQTTIGSDVGGAVLFRPAKAAPKH